MENFRFSICRLWYVVKNSFTPRYGNCSLERGHLLFSEVHLKYFERHGRWEPSEISVPRPYEPLFNRVKDDVYLRIRVEEEFRDWEKSRSTLWDHVWGPYEENILSLNGLYYVCGQITPQKFDIGMWLAGTQRRLKLDDQLSRYLDSADFYEALRGRACLRHSPEGYEIAPTANMNEVLTDKDPRV